MALKNVGGFIRDFLRDFSDRILKTLKHLRWKMVLAGVVVGLVSGALVATYRLGIEYGTDLRDGCMRECCKTCFGLCRA